MYPEFPDLSRIIGQLKDYSTLQHEYGAQGIGEILGRLGREASAALERLRNLPIDEQLARDEPDDLPGIHALRPEGPRRLWKTLNEDVYRDRLEGALLSRMAGCTLGAIVEFWPVERMESWAKYIGDAFPPVDYWSQITSPDSLRYGYSPCIAYTRDHLDGVPVDDDIAYTLLGLLIAEDHGVNFTVADVGAAWLKYLPYACTAEEAALANLTKGVPPEQAAEQDNPYVQWIGADIRSDPWGYMAPAYPEKAASLAYHDARISHRRNGVYGEMFFSAALSAAFAVDNAVDALKIGLTEIPKTCALYQEVEWALAAGRDIRNYKEARACMDERFRGMAGVHTINNACLTVWGLMIGGGDVTKTISETVAMGMDNDCTAATAGSIAGALAGKKKVPEHWYRNFNNKVHSYLIGRPLFAIDDLLKRFEKLAVEIHR